MGLNFLPQLQNDERMTVYEGQKKKKNVQIQFSQLKVTKRKIEDLTL